MRVVAIGDIGVVDDMIHIGDEAMFEALVTALRARGVTDVTGISANPAESAGRYGIHAIAPIGFGPDRAANEARRSLVISAASGGGMLAPDDPAVEVIDAVRSSDGVVIAGGGNMSSLWPHHIYERSTLGAIAAAFGVPLVVTGQTIGPQLGERDSELVGELLASARLVGLRESASHRLVSALGVHAHKTIDDATYLGDDLSEPGDYALVSLSNHVGHHDREAFASRVAALLNHFIEATGLHVRFLPHWGSLDASHSRGDSVLHNHVISRLHKPVTREVPTDARSAANLARGAALIVSSRYHPVVFGVPAGVPALGIPVDDYTTVKLSGALGNFGQDGLLPIDEVMGGGGESHIHRAWAKRHHTRDAAAELADARRRESHLWWDKVVGALN